MTSPLRSVLAEVAATGSLLPEGENVRWAVQGRAPAAVVAPASEEETGRILSRAMEEGWRVLPAGHGTWLEGGGCEAVDLVVSTRRMEGIREYEPGDLTLVAGGGITLSALLERTRAHNQWLALDPPGGWRGSLGGAVAAGIGGPLQHAYGTPRDHVLGLTIVSGEGRVLRWGGRVVKNVAGFDLTRLCVGSRGMLGVITSVSVRLFPLPARDLTLVVAGERAADLLPMARHFAVSALPLAAVELMDPLPDLWRTSHGRAGLVLRLLGSREEVVEMRSAVEAALFSGKVPGDSSVGAGEGSGSGRVTKLEESASHAFHGALSEWEGDWDLVFRMALLPSRLGVLLEEAVALQDWSSRTWGDGPSRLGVSAHAGAGVVRVGVRLGPGGPTDPDPWIERLGGLRERLETEGGSLVLSHGPRALVAGLGVWGTPEAGRALTEGLRRIFDPQDILVPGSLVP